MKFFNLTKRGEPYIAYSCPSFSHPKRRVAYWRIGKYVVSTVFLFLDHSMDGREPIYWETLVFAPRELPDLGERCGGSRWNAWKMHIRVTIKLLRSFL